MTGVLIRPHEDTEMHMQRKSGHVQTEAKIGVMQVQAEDRQRWLASVRSYKEAREDNPLEPLEGT